MERLVMSESSRRARAAEQFPVEDDALLTAIAKERSRKAFTQFFERYQHEAFGLAYKMMGRRSWAEDAVQETMLEVWCRAATFRSGQARNWL